jgi:hypothetical protein
MKTGMCGTYGKNRNTFRVSVRNPKEGELLEDMELDGSVIKKWRRIGLMWLKISTGGTVTNTVMISSVT